MAAAGKTGNVSSIWGNIKQHLGTIENSKRKAESEPENEEEDDDTDIENLNTPIPKELVPLPESGPITSSNEYIYNEYYRIPNYTNKYNTQDLLVIGRSLIPGAGLGLFAFVSMET